MYRLLHGRHGHHCFFTCVVFSVHLHLRGGGGGWWWRAISSRVCCTHVLLRCPHSPISLLRIQLRAARASIRCAVATTMSRAQTQAQHDRRHGEFQRAKDRLLRLFKAAQEDRLPAFTDAIGECAGSVGAGLAYQGAHGGSGGDHTRAASAGATPEQQREVVLSFKDGRQRSLLHFAAQGNAADVIRYVFDTIMAGASDAERAEALNAVDDENATPLLLAVHSASERAAKVSLRPFFVFCQSVVCEPASGSHDAAQAIRAIVPRFAACPAAASCSEAPSPPATAAAAAPPPPPPPLSFPPRFLPPLPPPPHHHLTHFTKPKRNWWRSAAAWRCRTPVETARCTRQPERACPQTSSWPCWRRKPT